MNHNKQIENLQVLYEDNHCIAVFKPAGILSQGDASGDTSIFKEVKKYLKEKYKKPGNVFLGLLHRLDRPVSGIMLFAKTSKGAKRLSEQFRNHMIEKKYQALVCGVLSQNKGVLVNRLGKDKKLKKAKEYADGKEARLYYEVLKTNGKYSLLEISIDTGKFHQIRAQLSLAGLPILGDIKYRGEKWENETSIALCATELHFQAVTEDKEIHLNIEIPKNWQDYFIHSAGLVRDLNSSDN